MGAEGEIAKRVMRGKPLDHIPVIDTHTHLDNSSGWYFVPRATPRQVTRYMDRFGVDHWLTFTLGINSDTGAANQHLFDITRDLRDRFSPLICLHAAFPADWPELLRIGAKHGARGIKLISAYQGVKEEKVDWSPALEFAGHRGWVVLNHNWGNAELLTEYARSFPQTAFIVGHLNGSGTAYRKPVATEANVFQSTCAHFACATGLATEELVKILPVEKILFGSDALDLDLGTGIGPIALADIPEEQKEMILGRNALAMMEWLGWKLPLTLKGDAS